MTAISGTRTLHRLIYTSRATVAGDALDEQVHDIIRTSIRNNREAAITGLLLVHAGHFVQALEGPSEAVMNTYRRILDDARHTQPKVLQAGPAGSREFADWNMCARRITPSDDAIIATLVRKGRFAPADFSAAATLRLLTAVRGIQSRTQTGALC